MRILYAFLLFVSMNGWAQTSSAHGSEISKIYSRDGITVRSYDFAALEKLLTQKNDTLYIVNFWATWCQPCIEELPHFEKLHHDTKDKKVKVLLVSLDMPKQVESRLIPFIKKMAIAPKVVLLDDADSNSWIPKVDANWSGAIPATLIYSNEKREFFEKSFTNDELQKTVTQF